MFIGSRMSVTPCFSATGAPFFKPSMIASCIFSCETSLLSSPPTTHIIEHFHFFATSQLFSSFSTN